MLQSASFALTDPAPRCVPQKHSDANCTPNKVRPALRQKLEQYCTVISDVWVVDAADCSCQYRYLVSLSPHDRAWGFHVPWLIALGDVSVKQPW